MRLPPQLRARPHFSFHAHLQTAFNICAMEHMIWQIAIAIHFVPIVHEVPRHVRDFWQQMLVESASRAALQRFLAAWQPLLLATRKQGDFKSLIRWAIDVDPLAI